MFDTRMGDEFLTDLAIGLIHRRRIVVGRIGRTRAHEGRSDAGALPTSSRGARSRPRPCHARVRRGGRASGNASRATSRADSRQLSPARRQGWPRLLEDDRLADLIEELPDDEAIRIIESLDVERAAHVIEEMEPDDAADLLGDLPGGRARPLCWRR